jgi:hypothetical protein
MDQALLVSGTPRSCRQPAVATALQASMRWCPDLLCLMIFSLRWRGHGWERRSRRNRTLVSPA